MREMNTYERMETACEKSKELMCAIFRMKQGEDINLNHIRHLIRDIYKDELELIDMLDEYELGKEFQEKRGPEIPSFMMKRA